MALKNASECMFLAAHALPHFDSSMFAAVAMRPPLHSLAQDLGSPEIKPSPSWSQRVISDAL